MTAIVCDLLSLEAVQAMFAGSISLSTVLDKTMQK